MPSSPTHPHPHRRSGDLPEAPTERTHLLSNAHLESIHEREQRNRLIRAVLGVASALSAIWLIALLTNTFTHVVFMSSPSAYAFAYASLALGCTLNATIFFHTPIPIRMTAILPVLFTINLLFCLAQSVSDQLRTVGVVSLLWALCCSFMLVAHAFFALRQEEQAEQEALLDDRHWAIHYVSILASSLGTTLLTVLAVIISFNLLLTIRDYGVLPPPGSRYKVLPQYAVHIYCSPDPSPLSALPSQHHPTEIPTILLEAGETPVLGGLATWAASHNQTFRYCYWDRPGYAYSQLAPSPHSAGDSAEALSTALALAGEKGPWLVVSAGKGAIVSRIFASRNPGRVAGLVLADGLHEDYLHQLGRPWRGLGLFIRAFISPLGIGRFGGLIFWGRSGRDRIFGRSALGGANAILAELQEAAVARSTSRSEIATARLAQDRAMSLAVITSRQSMGKDSKWGARQKDLTTITDELVWWRIVDAPHDIWDSEAGRQALTESVQKIIDNI